MNLLDDLRALGVTSGDVVMVHASLRALGAGSTGPLQGGAATVAAALDDAVAPGGTVLVVVGAIDDDAPFDYLRTPADPDVGALAEFLRRLPGTVANDHPDGRFAARGAQAAQLLANTPWNDYYGPGSPLERLVHLHGKVLRLGADTDTVTLLHYAEYLADVSGKRRVQRHHLVATDHGVEERTVDCLDDSFGIVDYPGDDYFAVILDAYLATGRATTGVVGNARSELIDAGDLVRYGAAWMTDAFSGLSRRG